MTELEQIILDSKENDIFVYDGDVLEKILEDAEHWKSNRLDLFKSLLRRIKREKGVPEHDPKNKEKHVGGPIGSTHYMAIFFTTDPKGYYHIYDFKLVEK